MNDPTFKPLSTTEQRWYGDRTTWLAYDLVEPDMTEHLDPDMPIEARMAVSTSILDAGTECDVYFQPRGQVYCQVCGDVLRTVLHRIEGDELANTKLIVYPAEALAHYVREHGLRIDPRTLISRFNIRPSGSKEPFYDTGCGAALPVPEEPGQEQTMEPEHRYDTPAAGFIGWTDLDDYVTRFHAIDGSYVYYCRKAEKVISVAT